MLQMRVNPYFCFALFSATSACTSMNVATTQREATSYSSLSQMVGPWIERAEEAEAGKSPGVSEEKLLGELEKASVRINSYLESNPDDVRVLLLAARLGRSLEIVRPVRIERSTLNQMESSRRERVERLQQLCDRALAVSPENSEAHYWKARLYGIRHFAFRQDRLIWAYIDLDRAVHYSRRAVELSPSSISYREALAQYLTINGQPEEAIKVMREVDNGQHLLYLLLLDQAAIRLPPGSFLWREETENRIQENIERGWDMAYVNMRIQQYVMPMTAADAEAFFRQTWPTFRFLGRKTQKIGNATMYHHIQLLRWQAGKLQPAAEEKDVPDRPHEGIRLTLTEFQNMKEHQLFPIPVSEVYSVMTVRNFRSSSR